MQVLARHRLNVDREEVDRRVSVRPLPSFESIIKARADLISDPALALMTSLSSSDKERHDRDRGWGYGAYDTWFGRYVDDLVSMSYESIRGKMSVVNEEKFGALSGFLDDRFDPLTGPYLARLYAKLDKIVEGLDSSGCACRGENA